MARSTAKQFVKVIVRLNRDIERAQKRAAREQAKDARLRERAQANRERQAEAAQRHRQKQRLADQRAQEQAFLDEGKEAYAARCQERAALRESVLKSIFK